MKVYILFKLKDVNAKKKVWIVDSVYTNKSGAFKRQERIHKMDTIDLLNYNLGKASPKKPVHVICSPSKQETYIINKTLKGLVHVK